MPTVDVMLFAGLRQRAGAATVRVDVAPRSTVRDLLAAIAEQVPAIADQLPVCRVAIDETFATVDDSIDGAREIALIPPVSGGHDGPTRYRLVHDPIALADVVAAVDHGGAGGIATFTGNVRRQSRGQTIEYLEYEAYESMALRVIEKIGAAVEAEHPGTRVAITHRLGHLTVGDTAVVIAASAPHRAEAFAACRAAIEALKRDVPIWKREVSTTGEQWIGSGP